MIWIFIAILLSWNLLLTFWVVAAICTGDQFRSHKLNRHIHVSPAEAYMNLQRKQ